MTPHSPSISGFPGNHFNLQTKVRSFVVLVALVLILSGVDKAQAAAWHTTGSLTTARYGHTATLLTNGKVLVAGGTGTSGSLSSAEIYDPATGTWVPAGTMANIKSYHTATLLTNGLVLVVGGSSGSATLGTAEIYDPASGTWSSTGSLSAPRYNHTATLLPNGSVLVAGGHSGSASLKSAELYNPATGTWTTTGSLKTTRETDAAVLLPNGTVLVVGGYPYTLSTEIYDPASQLWSTSASVREAHNHPIATLLPNGQVLVAGGCNAANAVNAAELWDPAGTNGWAYTGTMKTRRYYHTATLLPNGIVLAAGGYGLGIDLGTNDCYNPASGSWDVKSNPSDRPGVMTPRESHTATLLANGKVLVVGGGFGSTCTASAELYDPAGIETGAGCSGVGTWAATNRLATARANQTATLLPSGKVLVAGGQGSGSVSLSVAELFDPTTGAWTPTNSMGAARQLHTATLLPNGKVLVAGGNASGSALSSTELFDPSTGTWTATGPLSTARWQHTATLLPYGKVLVSGGNAAGGVLSSVELYDPGSQTWTATGRLTTPRCGHTATLLTNGKVLVSGGTGTSGSLSSAELFDPATGTWVATNPLSTARGHHTATLLPNGKVLVSGGTNTTGSLSSAALYDPATGTWEATGSLATGRVCHTATLLPNGKVLVSGGTRNSSPLTSAEVYDPATGVWSGAGPLTTARACHTATLLPNGNVLAAGGQGTSGNLSSAELYDTGVGFSASWQPQITTCTSPLSLGGNLAVTGSLFRGISEASGGNVNQGSSSDHPVVQIQCLGNEQTVFLHCTNWQANAFTAGRVSGIPVGYALATVFVNGIPSAANLLNINVATLPYSFPTSGSIGLVGQHDEWTFFGRAGRGVAVVVNPGGTASPAPNPPYLGLAQMAIFAPSGVLLGTASNTVSGQAFVWQTQSLPIDGTYRIEVSASAASPTNTGNYLATLWDAPASGASVLLNQQVFGDIATPYSVGQWTFSAQAGRQIQFHLVNVSGSGVVFDLTGPGGWTGFSSITSDSALITLPSSGTYTLTVRSSGGQYGLSYVFQLLDLSVTDLTLGTPYSSSLAGSGYAQIFRATTTVAQPLLVQLNDQSASDRNEVYVKMGSPPTRSDYDYRFSGASSPNEQILIPSAPAGAWYVLVYGDYVPSPSAFTISATSSDLFASAITPSHINSGLAPVFTLTGAGFVAGTVVELVDGNGRVFAAQSTTVDSFTEITATFGTGSLPAGNYTAQVHIPGQPPQPLSGTITIATGGAPHLVTSLIMPNVMGYHELATIYVQYGNTGTAAMPAPILFLDITQNGSEGAFLTLQQKDLAQGFWTSATPAGFSHSIQFLAGGAIPGVLQPGESFTVPVYYAGWQQPWNGSHPPFQGSLGVLAADNTSVADWALVKAGMRPASISVDAWEAIWASFVGQVGNTWGAYVQMLDNNAAYLDRLGQRVVDLGQLLAFAFQQADGRGPIYTLASESDATMLAPGMPLQFSRVFSDPISQRYQLGPLGRGWSHNWQRSLSVASDGTISIAGPAGSLRIFQPDSRNAGAFFSQSGDHGTLTAIGGGAFSLQEKNGMIYAFLSDGKLNYVQNPNGNRITCAYSGSQLVGLTHSSGQSLTLAYNAAGRIATVTDSLARQTTFAYDVSGEHLLSVVTYDGRTNTYTYLTGQGITKEHALSQIGYKSGAHRYFNYDTQGRLASTSRDGNAENVSFTYDSAGTVTAIDALGGATEFCFDRRGLLAKTENALGNVVLMSFDDNYNLTEVTDPAGQSYAFEHDANGNLVRSTDALGHSTRFSYTNVFNRLVSVIDAKTNTTQYAYDSKGNLTSTTYANNSRETWAYDTFGNPSAWTNRRGHPINYTHDANGRMSRKTYQDGSHVDFTYDAHGNLIKTVDATGTNTFTFSTTDYLTRISYPDGQWLQFTYDSTGQRASSHDQTGHQVAYAYDAAGRLASMTNELGASIVNYQYDQAGRVALKTVGNGVHTTYAYDPAGQLLHLSNCLANGTVLSHFDYTYDSRGRRTAMSTSYGQWSYAYDDMGQLTHAVLASTDPNISSQDLAYVYDALGNRVQTIENGTDTAYTVNNLNQFTQVGSTAYTFDTDGNLISEISPAGTNTYTYNDENRLISVSTGSQSAQYTFDALGNRVATTTNGVRTHFVIDPIGFGNVVGEYGDTGNMIAHYDHGLGLISRIDAGNNPAFYTYDAIGSVQQLITPAGVIANAYTYTPFGGLIGKTETLPNPFQFVGGLGVAMAPGGMQFMRARFYESALGAFTSNDPLRSPAGSSLYAYALNRPTSFSDASGKFVQLAIFLTQQGEIFLAEHQEDIMDVINQLSPGPSPATTPAGIVAQTLVNLGPSGMEQILNVATDFNDDTVNMGMYVAEDLGVKGAQLFLAIKSIPSPIPPLGALVDRLSADLASLDPNEKTGSSGFGVNGYVSVSGLLPYRVEFENATNATAPAQQVNVTDQLSTNLDWSTFQLSEIGFGDVLLAIPPGSQYYEDVVPMTCGGVTFNVEVYAGIDFAAGQAYANFYSIDPVSGLPPAVSIGFLPPEDGTGRGIGHVSYTVQPKAGLLTDTQIRNVADIVFDQGEIISTDQVDDDNPSAGVDLSKQCLLTVDSVAPTSAVASLPSTVSSNSFTVSWLGADDPGGSGLANYDVYVMDNSSAWTIWQSATTNTSAVFQGQASHTYGFFSVGRDNVGNVEAMHITPDATTTVAGLGPLLSIAVNAQQVNLSWSQYITNYYLQSSVSLFPSSVWAIVTNSSLLTNGVNTVTLPVSASNAFFRLYNLTPATVTSFAMDGGAATTTVNTVMLNLTYTGLPTYFMASENANFAGASWQVWTGTPTFTLSAGDGVKTVYFEMMNAANQVSGITSNTIILSVPVSVTLFAINNGAASTTDRNVTLNNTCSGTPLQFMASEDAGFAGAAWQTYATAPIFLLSTGNAMKTVYFKVQNALGVQSATASNTITYNGPSLLPTITQQPQSVTNYVGSNVTFSVTATGTAPLSYQWQWNGTNITDGANLVGATNFALAVTDIQAADAGNYDVVVANASGSVTSQVATLTVLTALVPPIITTGSPLPSGTVGTSYSQSLTATGGVSPYAWSLYSGSLPYGLFLGSGGSITGTPTAVGGYNFTLKVTGNDGAASSKAVSLTINSAIVPPAIATQPQAVTNYVGSNVTFSVAATGSAPLSYQWSLNSTNLSDGGRCLGSTSNLLTVTNIQASDAGNYAVVVTNSGGCATSAVAMLTVLMPLTITTATPLPAGTTGVYYNQALAATGSTTPYVWSLYSGSLPYGLFLVSGGSITGTPTAVGGYNFTLKVTGNDGAASTKTFGLTINAAAVPPSITTQPKNAMVVASSNVTFSVIATGTAPLNYQWQWKGTNVFDGGQLSGVTSNVLTVANAQLSNGGLYDVVIANTAGSVTSAVANLVVFVPPSITTQPHSITNSVGSNVTFSVAVAGSGPFSYQWRWNDANLSNGGQYSGVTSNVFAVSNIQMSNAGYYNVLVTNLVGSVLSSNAVLTVK